VLEQGKISSFQMAFIVYPIILASGFITLPTISSQYAGNDLWLSSLISFVPGMITLFCIVRLHQMYPRKSIIEYSPLIIGKIPGKLFSFVLIVVNLHGSGLSIRQFAEFVKGNFLLKTPLLVIMVLMIMLSVYVIRQGLEVLARTAVILLPLSIVPLILLLLLIPDLNPGNIFPILSHGFVPVLKGAVVPQAWLCQIYLVTFFLPSLSDPKKGGEWGLIVLGSAMVSLTYIYLLVLFLLGPHDISNKNYPILVAFRYISRNQFFENLEALLLAMWVIGNFIKTSAMFYCSVLAIAHLTKLSSYRMIIIPVGILIVILGLWDIPGGIQLGYQLREITPFEIFSAYLLLPLILFIIAKIRH